MNEKSTNIFLRISVTMAAIGVAMGVASWFSYEWLESADILAEEQAAVVLPVYPVITLVVVVVASPLTAGVLGIFEGLRGGESDRLVVTIGTSLVSGVLMIMLAALFIGQISPPGDAAVVQMEDAITVGGLAGIAAALSAAISTIINER